MNHHSFFRFILSTALLLSLIAGTAPHADDVQIDRVTDLQALGELAKDKHLPILIMFSQQECPYCSIMEESYLKPMLRSGEYGDKVIIRQVRIDDFKTLTDFDGARIEADHLTSRYRAWVTPTLVFLNHTGKEMAPKLVGIGTEGFFAGDIDDAIDMALARLRSVALRQVLR